MIWNGVWPALLGLVIGIAAAAGASQVLANALFEIQPQDPITYAAVAALLVTTALAAAYLPARRASLVDPRTALQN